MTSHSMPQETLTSSLELPLSEIAAISPEDAEKLQQHGITSNLDLLRVAGLRSQRAAFAQRVDVTVYQVNRWVVLADLSRIPSVGSLYCDFLLQIGICSTAQLAQISLSDLQRQVNRFQIPILHRADLCPGMGLIATWNGQAQHLSRSA